MKHIRNKPLLLLAATAATLLLASCTKELPTEAIGEGSYLSLSIDGQQSPSVEASPAASASASAPASTARQGASTRALTAEQESAVNNLWILQFQMTAGSTTVGKLVKKIYIDTPADLADLTKIKYSSAAGTNMALYLVANVGSTLFSSTAEGANGTSLANIKATAVTVTTTTGSNFPADNSANLPMVGQSANLTFPINTSVPIALTRTVAKVTLTVKNLLATSYPKLTITSTQLKNVPKKHSTQVVNSASSFIGTPYYPPASLDNFTNYTAATGNIPAAGTTWTYYLGPNARGTSTNTDDRLKSDATAPSGQGDFCTYVEILGKAKTTATSPDAEDVDVRYRLYLGGNNTNDFNLYSNTAYTVGIELTGLFSADARLTITTDKFDIVKGDSDGDHMSDAGDGWVEPVIGALKNGGVVYWVDPANPERYKIFSLDQGSLLKWSAEGSYDLYPSGVSNTDGKANVDDMKSYATTKNLNFSTAFPAAQFCDRKNTGGVTGWYLPAKDESKELMNNYSANKTVLEAAISDGNGVPMAAGESSLIWSSTEYDNSGYSSKIAHYADFSDNTMGWTYKHYSLSVRCIRNIAPPPAVGDYYYTDGTYSTSIESSKTVNGMVYYVDPTNPSKFKVLALDESSALSWSPNSYVVEGARSDTDGRGNSAAIKAVYDAKYTSSAFSSAFPAAAHCYNYRGKNNSDPVGTWHLPAKHELQYLYCAFNGASPTTWENSTTAATPKPNDIEKGKWNTRLTAVSSTNLTTRTYWASTESSAPEYAWLVSISDGRTPIDSKYWNSNGTYFVRCVRNRDI